MRPSARTFNRIAPMPLFKNIVFYRIAADWAPPAPRHTRGVLAKYAKLVSSSSHGAVTDA